ncbi:Na+-dependent transporter of the SNF family, partial [Snodgrassella alvi SCGC AB-598-J21]
MSGGTKKKSHSQWSSRMGVMLAAAGSAVGLGNIWKFPYMAGQM